MRKGVLLQLSKSIRVSAQAAARGRSKRQQQAAQSGTNGKKRQFHWHEQCPQGQKGGQVRS
jgi:hypothetical protein